VGWTSDASGALCGNVIILFEPRDAEHRAQARQRLRRGGAIRFGNWVRSHR
jgi:hypothetical protein